MTITSLSGRRCRPNPRFAAFAVAVLIWISPALCQGMRAIRDAAGKGDLVAVNALLEDNPDLVFMKDGLGWTPLHVAAVTGQKDVAELLVANKADVNARDDDGATPLHLAVRGHKDMAALLLADKADVNAADMDGWTPLHFAANFGESNFDVEEWLLAYNADVNAMAHGGFTPLHFAVAEGFADKAELLLANRADVNAVDDKGETPLQVLALKGHNDLVNLLRQHGGHE
jgi:ankyrin repeat protein